MKTLEEFKEEVKRHFKRCETGLSDAEVADYLEEPEAKSYIEEEYEIYKEQQKGAQLIGGDPAAIASTLSLMY